jgi:hypothetical protein
MTVRKVKTKARKSKAKPKTAAKVKTRSVAKRKPKKVGRPTAFSPAVGGRICAMVAAGKTWRDVVAKPGMPVLSTLARWVSENQGFREQHAHAREARAEVLLGEFEDLRKKLKNCKSFVSIRRTEVNINALKWLMAKFYRRVYGDKLDVETTQAPVEITYDYSKLSDAELKALQGLLEKAYVDRSEA